MKTRRELAARHGLEVWQGDGIEWECAGACNDTMVTTLEAVNANGGCPECGEAFRGGKILPGRWWWWSCLPGCLPDGPPNGPFDSEDAALDDALDGLE